MFHPWGKLRLLAHVRVSFVVMPDDLPGRTNGIDVIWLDRRLQQTERRCALAHELEHIERQHVGCQPPAIEAQVRHAVACQLITMPQLVSGLRWARSVDELAEELWVTAEILQDRFAGLTSAEWETLYGVELQHH